MNHEYLSDGPIVIAEFTVVAPADGAVVIEMYNTSKDIATSENRTVLEAMIGLLRVLS